MHKGDDTPRVGPKTPLKDVLFEMTKKRLGMTTVTNDEGVLLGVISDVLDMSRLDSGQVALDGVAMQHARERAQVGPDPVAGHVEGHAPILPRGKPGRWAT